jgi:hypothetical protein
MNVLDESIPLTKVRGNCTLIWDFRFENQGEIIYAL